MKEISTDFIEDILFESEETAQGMLDKKYPTAGFRITVEPNGYTVIRDKTGKIAVRIESKTIK